jgi:glucose dehydrogenase
MPQPGGRYFGGEYTRSRVPRRGVLAAVDVTTNRLAWRQQWGELCYAGSTVTGGGLLFIGRNDGRLSALDKANGASLWEFQTDAGIHAAVSTFERNGRQYVVALSAGSFFPNTTRGDSVWLFALDGAGAPSGASADPSGGAVELTH